LQNKKKYKITKRLQTSKKNNCKIKKTKIKLSKVQGITFVSKTIYNKPPHKPKAKKKTKKEKKT
jgi:hypothetical protein